MVATGIYQQLAPTWFPPPHREISIALTAIQLIRLENQAAQEGPSRRRSALNAGIETLRNGLRSIRLEVREVSQRPVSQMHEAALETTQAVPLGATSEEPQTPQRMWAVPSGGPSHGHAAAALRRSSTSSW